MLAKIQKEVNKLPKNTNLRSYVTDYFKHIGICLDFLEKDIDNFIIDNTNNYFDDMPISEFNAPFFLINPKTKERIPLSDHSTLSSYMQYHCPIRGFFHFENYPHLNRYMEKSEDLKLHLDYLRSILRLYTQGAIDLFQEAKAAKKLPEL